MQDIHTGAIVTSYEPALDYVLGKAGIPFDWEKGYEVPYIPPAKDQKVTSACGPFSVSSYKEVKNFIQNGSKTPKSPKFIYGFTHAPSGGTSVYDLGKLITTKGVADESVCPTTPVTEEELTRTDNITQEALDNALTDLSSAYGQVVALNDIETIAQAFRDHNGLILGVYGINNGSWTSENPQRPDGVINRWAHWMLVVKAGMYKGMKAVCVINSWGPGVGDKGLQWLTEDYFTSHNIWCAWSETEKDNVIVPVFKYQWNVNMRLGDNNVDVKALQKALKLQGYVQDVTGYFGPMTLANVNKFQDKYLGYHTGQVWPLTRTILNKMYL